MSEHVADAGEVKRALDRLLAWPDIARSPQLAKFLSYIVERRLNGDAQTIKAYSIAVDVFGRPPDFDPQADPIVRVQARRLRGLLDQYYLGPGVDEALRIQLPIGRYVPEFVEASAVTPTQIIGRAVEPARPAPAPPRPRGHITISWFVLLVLALGATAITYSLATWGPRREQQVAAAGAIQMPQLRVMEFQNLTGDSTITAAISALAIEVVTGFAPFTNVAVSLGGRGDQAAQQGQREGYELTGVVRRAPTDVGLYQVSAILTDLEANSIVWNRSFAATQQDLIGRAGVDAISLDILLAVGNTRGPLHARAWDVLERSDAGGQQSFYLCTVLFVMYRTTLSAGAAERANACIQSLPENQQNTGMVLAAKASLIAEGGLATQQTAEDYATRMQQAEAFLDAALQAAPTSFFVWEQRARLHEVTGLHDQAESEYGTALQLNPASVDATAAHARHLALIGRMSEALPLAQRAIDSVPLTRIPSWFSCVPALGALRADQLDRALSQARTCARGDIELGSVLALVAAQRSGNAETIARQLPRVLEVPNFRNFGVMTYLGRRIDDPVLLEEIGVSLAEVGVPAQSLISAY